jgi:hypothetical protein
MAKKPQPHPTKRPPWPTTIVKKGHAHANKTNVVQRSGPQHGHG